jgi:hypothetical protein
MFLVVPHRVTETTAEIFVGAFFDQEPPEECRLLLEPVGQDRQRDLYAGHWSTLSGDGKSAIHYLRRTFSSLPPATAFDIRLLGPTGEVLARGSVETMPGSLPLGEIGSGPDRPFTLWLSSCFYSPRAASGLEQMVKSVVRDDRIKPHLKILAGDQVYLDFPQSKTVLFGKERLRQHFNEVYTSSWTHPAFSELLCNGGNVFLADDHEFWNNYPDSLIPVLWELRGEGFRDHWERLAKERCAAMQSVAPLQRLDIGGADGRPPELSIMAAQTRLDRSRGPYRFMSDEALDELLKWMAELQSPGVLALTQPLFVYADPTETGIPDFRQFRERLEPALAAAKHDIVVITGDPHFGRIGVVSYDAEGDPAQGGIVDHQLIEVIASPLTLVSAFAGNAKPPQPRTFPHYGPMSERWTIDYPRFVSNYASGNYMLGEEHAMLLSFFKSERQKLTMRVLLRLARQDTPANEWSWDTELA